MFLSCILSIFIIHLPSVSAATISGDVYDYSFEIIDNVIVTINTTPKQQLIAKTGTYSFEAPLGQYVLTAKYYEDNILQSSTEEFIDISREGNYVIDLILFPSLDEEEKLFEAPIDAPQINFDRNERNVNDVFSVQRNSWTSFFVIFAFVLLFSVLFGVWFFLKKQKKLAEQKIETSVEAKGPVEASAEPTIIQVEDVIKKHLRITQKELRKQLPFSEAKVSLILTELEANGKIKKIKRGRGNIIIYNK
ncbi:MAG: hypothetical protein QXK37_04870 [Candidatus Woesearchaeota archaeon]